MVEMTVNTPPSYVCIKWSKDGSTLDNKLQKSFLNKEGLDMTLATIDCKKIKVHQVMMSSISPFFANILKDLEPPSYPVIVLSDIKFEEIQSIVELLYNGEVIIEASRIEYLLKAAEILQIKGLIDGKSIYEAVEKLKRSQGILRNRRHKKQRENDREDLVPYLEDNVSDDDITDVDDEVKEKVSRNRRSSTISSKEMKTATIATLSAPQASGDGTLTLTYTTQVVPIISTILIETPRPVVCDKCGIVCPNDKILRAHKKLHEKPQNRMAPVITENPVRSNQNKPKKPNRLKIHQCTFCPYASEHVTNLLNHVRTHTGEKPYKCDQCQRSFSRKGTLLHHKRSHTGERPFQCEHCSKKFLFKHNLTSHITALHSSDKKLLPCQHCDKSFNRKKEYKEHLKEHECSDQLSYYNSKQMTVDETSEVQFNSQAGVEEVVTISMSDNIQVPIADSISTNVPIEIENFPVSVQMQETQNLEEQINVYPNFYSIVKE